MDTVQFSIVKTTKSLLTYVKAGNVNKFVKRRAELDKGNNKDKI